MVTTDKPMVDILFINVCRTLRKKLLPQILPSAPINNSMLLLAQIRSNSYITYVNLDWIHGCMKDFAKRSPANLYECTGGTQY